MQLRSSAIIATARSGRDRGHDMWVKITEVLCARPTFDTRPLDTNYYPGHIQQMIIFVRIYYLNIIKLNV